MRTDSAGGATNAARPCKEEERGQAPPNAARTKSSGFAQVLAETPGEGAPAAANAGNAGEAGEGAVGGGVGLVPFGGIGSMSGLSPDAPLLVSSLRGHADGPNLFRGSSRDAKPDPLDPATRQSAQLAPLVLDAPIAPSPSAASAALVEGPARASLEDMLPTLVRRIAWSGDGRKGTLRLEFGAGALAGGTLLVTSDEGRVRVELDAPAGVDTAAWKERIASRLEERRLEVSDIEVR
jgi:hypothetical protein